MRVQSTRVTISIDGQPHFLTLFAPALKGAKAENALSPFRAGAKQSIFCRCLR